MGHFFSAFLGAAGAVIAIMLVQGTLDEDRLIKCAKANNVYSCERIVTWEPVK